MMPKDSIEHLRHDSVSTMSGKFNDFGESYPFEILINTFAYVIGLD